MSHFKGFFKIYWKLTSAWMWGLEEKNQRRHVENAGRVKTPREHTVRECKIMLS